MVLDLQGGAGNYLKSRDVMNSRLRGENTIPINIPAANSSFSQQGNFTSLPFPALKILDSHPARKHQIHPFQGFSKAFSVWIFGAGISREKPIVGFPFPDKPRGWEGRMGFRD